MVRSKHPITTPDELRSQLRRHGLRATKQRMAVHEVMMELEHASADMVQEKLADYRIYSRRMSATNKMFFDIVASRHIHLYDRENHTYRNLQDEELSTLVAAHLKRRKFKGYTIEDIDIQLIAKPTRKNKKI